MTCCVCAVVPALLFCFQFGDQEGVRGVFVAMLELLKQKVGERGLLTFWAGWYAFDCAWVGCEGVGGSRSGLVRTAHVCSVVLGYVVEGCAIFWSMFWPTSVM
jgi:hypothetical protein